MRQTETIDDRQFAQLQAGLDFQSDRDIELNFSSGGLVLEDAEIVTTTDLNF